MLVNDKLAVLIAIYGLYDTVMTLTQCLLSLYSIFTHTYSPTYLTK